MLLANNIIGLVLHKFIIDESIFYHIRKVNGFVLISALWVTYIEGHILRLPCKEVGEFTITKDNFEYQGSVVATFTNLQDFECEDKCRLNPKCKSINMEKEGSKSCQLNSVSTSETITAGNALVAKTGWVYKTTDYNSTLIGENCQLLKPCPFYHVCRDLCSCQGYECLTPKDCMDIQRRNATTNSDYWIIPTASPIMPMQDYKHSNNSVSYSFILNPIINGRGGFLQKQVPGRFVLMSALWVSYIEGHILRLPCKEVGEFTIAKDNFELQGSVVATFTNLQDFECEDKCRLNPKCKSINMEKEGSKSCQLNSVSTSETITAGNALVAKTGWVYKTTDYNSTLIAWIFKEEMRQQVLTIGYFQMLHQLCRCNTFEIGSESDGYRLKIGGYSGNAGDSLAIHNGMKFSTPDRDNDEYGDGNCALKYKSGWWFKICFRANINNPYPTNPSGTGNQWYMTWFKIKNQLGNIVFSEMKLKYVG
eukprot:gene17988-19785_t